jgi:hypothetical protein
VHAILRDDERRAAGSGPVDQRASVAVHSMLARIAVLLYFEFSGG